MYMPAKTSLMKTHKKVGLLNITEGCNSQIRQRRGRDIDWRIDGLS